MSKLNIHNRNLFIKICYLIKNPFFVAFFLNIAYLVGMLCIYKPFLSIDDYLMSETAYGVESIDYDYKTKYMNFNYGKLIVTLLKFFPNIPWYTILFYIWIFLALLIVSKIILDCFPKSLALFLVNIILMYFSYEGYICVQFTKVAGITGAAGVLAIFIGHSWLDYLLGIVLFIISILVRYDMAKMVMGAFFAMIVLTICLEFFLQQKILLDRKIYFKFGVVIILFLIIPRIPSYDSSEKHYWNYFWKCNSNRSFVQDYNLPDYEKYKAIYEKLDISQNDIYIWKSWNADGAAITSQRVDILRKISNGLLTSIDEIEQNKFQDENIEDDYNCYILERTNGNKEKHVSLSKSLDSFNKKLQSYLNKDIIFKFFKEFPKAFLTIDVAFAYFLCIFFVLILNGEPSKYSMVASSVSFLIGIFLNYYLYVKNRYLQHRVDVGIFFVLICIFIILCRNQNFKIKKETKNYVLYVMAILLLIILITPYKYYADDYNDCKDERLSQNQKLVQYMASNEQYCYQVVANKTKGTKWYRFYDAFTVPEKNYCKNIFCGYGLGNIERYKNYGIDYIYSDIVDNNEIFLVMDDSDTNERSWEEYISKHSGKNVHLEFQEKLYGAKFYLVKSDLTVSED